MRHWLGIGGGGRGASLAFGCRVRRSHCSLAGLTRRRYVSFRTAPHRGAEFARHHASAIAEALPLATPELQRLAVSRMHDLIAATIRATRDGRAIAEGCGIAAARLRAIMADVTSNLGDGDLGVSEIARRHRVTPRTSTSSLRAKPSPSRHSSSARGSRAHTGS
jgi:hypothetical protein